MKKGSLGYEIFMTALILVIIAGVAGALLGLVNYFTAVDPMKLLEQKASEFYDGRSVEPYKQQEGFSQAFEYEGGEVLGVYVPKDDAERNVYILRVKGSGAYKGALELLVCIKDSKITKIAKYDANETPGLGSKALEQKHLDQYINTVKITSDFKGFGLTKYDVEPEMEGVDHITGATKSSTAVNNALNVAVKWYQNIVLRGEQK